MRLRVPARPRLEHTSRQRSPYGSDTGETVNGRGGFRTCDLSRVKRGHRGRCADRALYARPLMIRIDHAQVEARRARAVARNLAAALAGAPRMSRPTRRACA